MFGSIVAISDFELWLSLALTSLVLILTLILYKENFAIAFDEESAGLCGIPVRTINFIMMLLTAIVVSVASRIVGALMISSLLVIPVATSMLISKSYKQTLILSIVISEFITLLGLYISFYMNLRPGGTIVLLGVVVLIITSISKKR
jgi:zinc transport system permease protein